MLLARQRPRRIDGRRIDGSSRAFGLVRGYLPGVDEANTDQHQGSENQQRAQQAQQSAASVFGDLYWIVVGIVVGHETDRARAVPREAQQWEGFEIAKKPTAALRSELRANAPRRRRLPRLEWDYLHPTVQPLGLPA